MALHEPRLFRHYKGGLYEKLGEAIVHGYGELVVIYRQLATGKFYVRDYNEFFGMVQNPATDNRRLKRFNRVSKAERERLVDAGTIKPP